MRVVINRLEFYSAENKDLINAGANIVIDNVKFNRIIFK